MAEATGGDRPNGLEKRFGERVLAPAPVVYAAERRGPGGVGIATGELYRVADDPWQRDNRWDDPALAARSDDLVDDLYASLPSEVRHLEVVAPA
jgi:hypothetical protein